MDSTEQEFWNLEDSGADPSEESHDPPNDDDPQPASSPVGAPVLSDDIATPESGPGDADKPGSRETPDTDSSHPREPSGRSSSGKGEKIALAVVGLILLLGVIWGVVIFMGSPLQGNNREQVEFPVKGTSVVISSADTYWREPDRTADLGVQMQAKLIPAAVIKLGGKSANCALRFFFSDDKGDFVGDPITEAVTGGKFDRNGTDEIEVYGTVGFSDPGDHAAYATEQIDTWHLVIMEGPDRNALGAELKKIARVPISFNRK